MTKTNDTSNLFHATLDDHGTLADTALAAVTGGMLNLGATTRASTAPQSTEQLTQVLQQLLQVMR